MGSIIMRISSRDVSDYQSNVKWQTVARGGIVFSFVKSTADATLVSQTLARNWVTTKVAGI